MLCAYEMIEHFHSVPNRIVEQKPRKSIVFKNKTKTKPWVK